MAYNANEQQTYNNLIAAGYDAAGAAAVVAQSQAVSQQSQQQTQVSPNEQGVNMNGSSSSAASQYPGDPTQPHSQFPSDPNASASYNTGLAAANAATTDSYQYYVDLGYSPDQATNLAAYDQAMTGSNPNYAAAQQAETNLKAMSGTGTNSLAAASAAGATVSQNTQTSSSVGGQPTAQDSVVAKAQQEYNNLIAAGYSATDAQKVVTNSENFQKMTPYEQTVYNDVAAGYTETQAETIAKNAGESPTQSGSGGGGSGSSGGGSGSGSSIVPVNAPADTTTWAANAAPSYQPYTGTAIAQTANSFLQQLEDYSGPSYAQMAAGDWAGMTSPTPDKINISSTQDLPTTTAFNLLNSMVSDITTAGGTIPASLQSEVNAVTVAYQNNPSGTYQVSNAQGIYNDIASQFGTGSTILQNYSSAIANTNMGGNAMEILQNTLTGYGLGSLANWAWNKAVNGESQAQILTELRATPEYKAMYPGMAQLQAKGYPAISEATYNSYTQNAMALMQQAGLPQQFYNNPTAIGDLIGNNISISELAARLTSGYAAVEQAPASVRTQFGAMFGIHGDQMLASHFLDQTQALPILQNQVQAASIGGEGQQLGLSVGAPTAMQLAQMGVTAGSAQGTLAQLSQQSGFYQQNPGQQNNVDINGQAIPGAFGLNAQDQQDMARTLAAQKANFAGGGALAGGANGQVGAGMEQPF